MERVIDATAIRADGRREMERGRTGLSAKWQTKRKAEAYLGVDP